MSKIPSPGRLEKQLWMILRNQHRTSSKTVVPSPDTLAVHQSMAELLDDPSFLERYDSSWYPIAPLPISALPTAHRMVHYVYVRFLRDALQPPQEILPYGLLDETALFSLLRFSYPALEQIVLFLGLHDLAAQLSQVVDKKILIALTAALSTSQQQYLQYCARQPRRWIPPKWDLAQWDKTPKTLWEWVFEQGFMRMVKATCKETASFQWHLVRRFDKKWEPLYTQIMKAPLSQNLADYFHQQLLSLLERIQ